MKKKTNIKKNSVEKRIEIMKKDKIKSPFFKVSIILSYDTIIGEGETMVDALNQFKKDIHFKSKGTMIIESDGKKSSIILKPIEMKRLLSKEINKVFFEKRMLSIMK
jgi:hypothetical protein